MFSILSSIIKSVKAAFMPLINYFLSVGRRLLSNLNVNNSFRWYYSYKPILKKTINHASRYIFNLCLYSVYYTTYYFSLIYTSLYTYITRGMLYSLTRRDLYLFIAVIMCIYCIIQFIDFMYIIFIDFDNKCRVNSNLWGIKENMFYKPIRSNYCRYLYFEVRSMNFIASTFVKLINITLIIIKYSLFLVIYISVCSFWFVLDNFIYTLSPINTIYHNTIGVNSNRGLVDILLLHIISIPTKLYSIFFGDSSLLLCTKCPHNSYFCKDQTNFLKTHIVDPLISWTTCILLFIDKYFLFGWLSSCVDDLIYYYNNFSRTNPKVLYIFILFSQEVIDNLVEHINYYSTLIYDSIILPTLQKLNSLYNNNLNMCNIYSHKLFTLNKISLHKIFYILELPKGIWSIYETTSFKYNRSVVVFVDYLNVGGFYNKISLLSLYSFLLKLIYMLFTFIISNIMYVVLIPLKPLLYLFSSSITYSLTYVFGISTVFIVISSFLFFTMLDSPTLIGLLIKLMLFLFTSILYLLSLNLDPWACFMVVIFIPSIFLLSVILNSIRYLNNRFLGYSSFKLYTFILVLFILSLVYALPTSNVDSFYQNLYSKNSSYTNLDFLGFSILLFSNSIIVPFITMQLTFVSLFIIIRFKLSRCLSNGVGNTWLFNYLGIRVCTDYLNLIDYYFLNKKPIISKFFRFFKKK